MPAAFFLDVHDRREYHSSNSAAMIAAVTELHTFLVEHPVSLLFLIVGFGYLVGKIRISSFDFGPVSGVLFVGLVFGYFGYELSHTVQTLGFVMFICSRDRVLRTSIPNSRITGSPLRAKNNNRKWPG